MDSPILLSVDLSAPSSWRHALPAALAMRGGNPLHVVTVVPNFGMSIVGSFFDEGFKSRALHAVGEAMNAWVNEHIPDDVEVHPHVVHGRVYEEILHAADRLDVGTIVLAAHTPELTDYLLGPNAARVVRHARQSVFVVRG
ncbi:universal stress protein [Profundibacterium mesophilum]|uniref:Dethiobiotin synthetase n=1 Tax=Profundibacterium mesophilum KAUST100406-0324 TaxID=1037889 RepID=A0A921NPF5_9RHOB|nr:universal stress protein [Profundibacterium mesophilum]KAF0675367.1 dethiobiotin synthetase [Profundibacterium mesophilum KAUST100406-0324]